MTLMTAVNTILGRRAEPEPSAEPATPEPPAVAGARREVAAAEAALAAANRRVAEASAEASGRHAALESLIRRRAEMIRYGARPDHPAVGKLEVEQGAARDALDAARDAVRSAQAGAREAGEALGAARRRLGDALAAEAEAARVAAEAVRATPAMVRDAVAEYERAERALAAAESRWAAERAGHRAETLEAETRLRRLRVRRPGLPPVPRSDLAAARAAVLQAKRSGRAVSRPDEELRRAPDRLRDASPRLMFSAGVKAIRSGGRVYVDRTTVAPPPPPIISHTFQGQYVMTNNGGPTTEYALEILDAVLDLSGIPTDPTPDHEESRP